MRGKRRWTSLLTMTVLLPVLLQANVFQTGTSEEIVDHIDAIAKKKTTDKNTVTNLIQTLKNPDTEIRIKERAAWALGELGAQSAVGALTEAAQHKGLLIRSAALDSLIRLRAKSALPIITKIAESDPILSLRQRATIGLGLLRSDSSIPVVVKLSSDPSTEIQGAAALAMSALHSKKNDFSEVLKEMTQEVDVYVKSRARVGLDIVSKKSKDVRAHLQSDDMDIRLFAAIYFRHNGVSSDLTSLKDAINGEAQDDIRTEINESIRAIKRRADETKKKQAAQKPKSPTTSQPSK